MKIQSVPIHTANLAFLLLLLCVARPASARQDLPEESLEAYTARLESIFQEEFDAQNDTTALWIGIADPDYGDLYFVLGNATRGPDGTPATLEHRFDIGSISKTMGGTTILLLAEEGLLSLDDAIETLIPDFTALFPEYSNYTVEELLRMKTVVPDFLNDPNGLLNDYAQNITQRYSPEDIVTAALATGYPAPLGTYSTTNIVVLDVVAEAVTNQGIAELLKERIFGPLGMANSVLLERYGSGVHPEPAATPYAGPACLGEFSEVGYAGLELYANLTDFSQGIVMAGTGGAVNSDIKDLLLWTKTGTGDSLLSPDMVERRHIYDSVLQLGSIEYGMTQYQYGGFQLAIVPAYDGWYGHSGDAFGFGANAFKNDELNVSVATGVNTCGYGNMHDMVIRVVTEEIKARRNATDGTSGVAPTTAEGENSTVLAENGGDGESNTTAPAGEGTLEPTSAEPGSTPAVASSAVAASLRYAATMMLALALL